MPLTDVAIRAAKPTDKVRKLSDANGLQLWIMPSGAKVWNLAFRFEGRQRKLTIGRFPETGLKDARRERDEALDRLRGGIDPAAHKQANSQKANKQANETPLVTFANLAAEVLAKKRREGKASATIGKREWLYSLASQAFGARDIKSVTPGDVLALLRSFEAKGQLETARRLRASISEVFRFGIPDGRAASDPTRDLRGAIASPVTRHRAAFTDAKGFGGLLRAIEGYEGQPATKAALQLMAILFPRPGDLRQAQWSEFDLQSKVWAIPASRFKMRREHRVPLPPRAVEILEGLKAMAHPLSPYLFAGLGDPRRPMSENTLNAALRRLGFTAEEASAHGFRASASTLLNESGKWSPDAIERALGHQDTDAVRRAYARGERWDERVKMAAWWSDYLDALRDGARVIPLIGGASTK